MTEINPSSEQAPPSKRMRVTLVRLGAIIGASVALYVVGRHMRASGRSAVRTIEPGGDVIKLVTFLPGGQIAAVGTAGQLYVLSPRLETVTGQRFVGRFVNGGCLSTIGADQVLVSGTESGTVAVNVNSGAVAVLPGDYLASSVSRKHGRVVAYNMVKQRLELLSLSNMAILRSYPKGCFAGAACDYNDLVAVGGDDGNVRIFSGMADRPRLVLRGARAPIVSVVTDTACNIVAARTWNDPDRDRAYVWDVRSGKLLGSCLVHESRVLSIALSRDGRRLAIGGDDRHVLVFEVRGSSPVGEYEVPTAVGALAFSSDGSQVAVGAGSHVCLISLP